MTRPAIRSYMDGDRAAAFEELASYYADVYGNGRDSYAIPAGRTERPSKTAADGHILLVDGLGGQHQSPRPGCHLYAKLAARRAGRQSSDGRHDRLERDQLRAAAGGNRRNGLVFRFAGTPVAA